MQHRKTIPRNDFRDEEDAVAEIITGSYNWQISGRHSLPYQRSELLWQGHPFGKQVDYYAQQPVLQYHEQS